VVVRDITWAGQGKGSKGRRSREAKRCKRGIAKKKRVVSTSKAREGTGRKEGEGVVRMRTGKEAQSKRAEIDDGVSEAKEHTQDKEEGERPRVRFARKKKPTDNKGPKKCV